MQPQAMWLAAIFGPYLILQGLWLLFYHENANKVITSLKNTPGALYILTGVSLLLGLGIIHVHNMWVMNLSVLVTLLGWMLIVRGVLGLFMPQVMLKIWSGKSTNLWGVIVLIWGVLLSWNAYMAA